MIKDIDTMKIAIIGAGISGLACAFELKKHGIIPTIFERRHQVGEVLGYPTLMLRMLTRNINNPMKYLRNEFGLNISPLSQLRKIEMVSPNRRRIIKGNHGYIFIRGAEQDSLENQIYKQAGLPVVFDTYVDPDNIKNDFDYIIVAVGDNSIGIKMGIWETTFSAMNRVATVLGDFETKSAEVWLDTRFAKNAFAYLIAETPHKAKLSIVVNNISSYELDYYWKEFLSMNDFPYHIIETKEMEHDAGFAYPVRINNIYFTGNSAGMTCSFIGLGSFRAIQSGIFAALSIAKGFDYTKLMQPLIDEVRIYNEFRKAVNALDNRGFDSLVSTLGFPVIKQILYNNPFFKAAYGDSLIRAFNRHMRKL